MRMKLFVPFVLAAVIVPAAALGDIGPPPKCPPGQHDEYNMGHHCVADAPADPTATAAPSASTAPTTTPSTTASPGVPTATPPGKSSCACDVAGRSAGGLGALAALGLAVVALGRRRR